MKIITVDFETYYDKEYSLSKLTTEEYIRSPLFEVIGVSVKVDDGETQWFSGDKTSTGFFLKQFDWSDCIAVAHNAVFDMAILNWHFNIRPKRIADTLAMARALGNPSVSLASLVKKYEIGEKGDEVVNALGIRRVDFGEGSLRRYAAYCCHDTELTYKLFGVLSVDFPLIEMKLIDLTVRMFTEPKLHLERNALETHLTNVRAHKCELLNKAGADIVELMSNDKLAEKLESIGVVPPTKVSARTGKVAWAFSKQDDEFMELLNHEDMRVQTMVAARLGVKSTLEETRTQRFIEIQKRGLLPIPLRFYAAHTGRWGGEDKINMQNLTRKSPLKYAIRAPAGYVLCDSDSSQIEARTLAWLSCEDQLVYAFEKGEDVYKIMAGSIYNKKPEDVSKEERFLGKTVVLGCIAEGTPVLCERGWVPIEQVALTDRVWDGVEWVWHQGLLKKGQKETLELCGLWLTPDHRVLCGTQWQDALSVQQEKSSLYQALGTGVASLPSLGTCSPRPPDAGSKLFLSSAIVGHPSTWWTDIILSCLKVPGATHVPRNPPRALGNYIGGTQMYYPTMNIENGFSTGFHQPLGAATRKPIGPTEPMVSAAYRYAKSGVKIARRFLSMSKLSRAGITPLSKWIEQITAKATNRETYSSSPAQRTCETREKCTSYRRSLMTYDLALAGPRNRYTVASSVGPLIVHNCGYGLGAERFQKHMKTQGVKLTPDTAAAVIATYRTTFPQIPLLWEEGNKVLDAIMMNRTATFGRDGVLQVEGEKGIKLPNGMYLRYPNLRKEYGTNGKSGFFYDSKRGRGTVAKSIWGGGLVENVCQALARIVIGEQMLKVNKKYPVVMTVHDAIACLIPECEATTGQEFVELCMKLRPDWALDLPLNCEAGCGPSYGDC